MAKKRAKRGEKAATRNAKNKADIRRKALRRRAGDVKRVELQLNADSPRDQYIAANLNELDYGTTSEYVRCAIEEKIARAVAARNDQIATENALDALRNQVRDQANQIAKLHEENTELRLNGGAIDVLPVTVLSDEDAKQKMLSGKLKKISFGGLMQ